MTPGQATPVPQKEAPPTVGLVVTGGIGTGKSAFVKTLMELSPDAVLHDADAVVHLLYADLEVRASLSDVFGPGVLVGHDRIDRGMVRQAVFTDPGKRRQLAAIFHPRVRAACQASWKEAVRQGRALFLAEIPLFFEGGQWKPDPLFQVVVVACSPRAQRDRLAERNPFDKDTIERIISSQADLAAKMAAADFVVWNEGGPQALRRQATLLVEQITPRTRPA